MDNNRSVKTPNAEAKAAVVISAALILSAICVLLFTLLYFTAFDKAVRSFDGGILLSLAKIFLIGGIAATIIFACTLPKASGDLTKGSAKNREAIIPAASMAGTFAFTLIGLFSKNFAGHTPAEAKATRILLILNVLLSVLSALYFLIRYFGITSAKAAAVAGFGAIIQPIAIIGLTYYDQYMELNAPEKLGIQFGYATFMIFATCEIRFLIGKPMPRMTLAVGGITVIISSAAFIPATIAHLADILYTVPGALVDSNDYLWFSLAGILNTAYVILRLLAYRKVFAAPIPEAASAEAPESSGDGDNTDDITDNINIEENRIEEAAQTPDEAPDSDARSDRPE